MIGDANVPMSDAEREVVQRMRAVCAAASQITAFALANEERGVPRGAHFPTPPYMAAFPSNNISERDLEEASFGRRVAALEEAASALRTALAVAGEDDVNALRRTIARRTELVEKYKALASLWANELSHAAALSDLSISRQQSSVSNSASSSAAVSGTSAASLVNNASSSNVSVTEKGNSGKRVSTSDSATGSLVSTTTAAGTKSSISPSKA